MDTTGLNGVDFADINVDVTGSSNDFDWDIGESSGASYLDLDFILDGDSGDYTFDIDSDYYTADIDILGDSKEFQHYIISEVNVNTQQLILSPTKP